VILTLSSGFDTMIWEAFRMRITYNADVDALYIRLIEDPSEVTTRRLSEDVAIDYASNGEVVGIEVLAASEHAFRPGDAPSVILESLLAVSG
jgi:uncharacterized protein YuzE